MVYDSFRSERFKKGYKKLDHRQQELIDKKIQKIIELPELGKPLRAPLSNFKSERTEKLRIIYTLEGKTVG